MKGGHRIFLSSMRGVKAGRGEEGKNTEARLQIGGGVGDRGPRM